MNAAEYLLEAGEDGHVALECGARRTTYAELRAAVKHAAGAWRERGLQTGERVLVFAPDSIDWVIAYLGAIWAGGVAVGLNSALFEKELGVILGESGARFIWCSAKSRDTLARLLGGILVAPQIVLEDEWSGALEGAAQIAASDLPNDAMAMWIYTSGTTGVPKAVLHAQRSVFAADAFAVGVLGLGRQERIYATSKLFFAYALGNSLFAGLRLGATVILDGEWPNAGRVAEIVERHRPTVVFSVPTLYLKMLQAGVGPRLKAAGVRHYVSAGEALPDEVRNQWREAGGAAPVSGYGTSETVFLLFYCDDDSGGLKPAPFLECRLSQGAGDATPRRVWLRHPSVALGYWKRPDAEQDSFDAGWFSPGDLFLRDKDGTLEFCGRDDDMLKISGQWVSVLEVERTLLSGSGASVQQLAAVGFANAEGLASIALFAVASPGKESEAERRIAAGIDSLPKLKRPRLVKWVAELPLTATGKLQRRKLKEQYLNK